MLDLQNAHSAKDLEIFSKIYAEVVERWEAGGSLSSTKVRCVYSDPIT